MRKPSLLLMMLIILSALAHGQASRWDWSVQTINSPTPQPGGLYPVLTAPGSAVAICSAPANGTPCTNYATTYVDSTGTTTCPGAAQLTRANSAICVAVADQTGGFGAWLKAGNYQYTITTKYGNYGPFDLSIASGSGGGSVSGQTPAFVPLATGATVIGKSSPLSVDDVNTPTKVTSTVQFVAPSAILTGLGSSTSPVCPNGTSGALTTIGCAGGGGTPGGSNLQFQFNDSAAFGGAAGVTVDAATQGRMQSVASVPALTPYSDIRHPSYGATCNGTADDAPAIQAAINAAAAATTGSGVVYIPDGCHMASGSGLTNPNTAKQLTLNLQGNLTVGSTLVLPPAIDFICLAKGNKPQFATAAPTCSVTVANVYGTVGTAITSTNTPVTITPTFTGGSIANMTVGSAITIAGKMTCGTTGAVRSFTIAGPYPGNGPTNTVYSIGTCVNSSGNAINFRIPPAAHIVVTGCSDTSYNTPTGGLFSSTADFPALTLGTRMVGTAGTLADTSCSINGFDLDNLETARIQAVSGSTVTISTNHVHGAGDLYGMVGMSGATPDLAHKVISGVTVGGNYGAGYFANGNSMMRFVGVSFSGVAQYLTSMAMDLESSWGWTFEGSQTTGYSGYSCPTVSFNCGEVGPPFDVLMGQLPQSLSVQNNVGGGIWGPNSTISHGMYITPNGSRLASYETGPVINNSVCEQPMMNCVTFDNRNTLAILQTTIEDSLIQDNIVGWSTAAWVGFTDDTTRQRGAVSFQSMASISYGPNGVPAQPTQTVNKYFCGKISVGGAAGLVPFVYPSCPQATVTFSDGGVMVGDLNTPSSGLTYVPYATKTSVTDPTSWTCSGTGCTVTAGKLAPDGSTTAGEVAASAGNFSSVSVSSAGTYSTAAGDVFLYGVWTRVQDGISQSNMSMQTFGTDTYDSLGAPPTGVLNEYWHPIIGLSVVKVGQAGNHTLQWKIWASQSTTGTTAQFWQPFVIQVPASAGVPLDEVRRWAATALHGYVPSGLSAGSIMALSPAIKMYWGNDTNLYRGAAGSVKTDGIFDPAGGYGCGGSVGTSGYLMSSGGAGVPCAWIPASGAIVTNVPPWLTNLGTGADGANLTASGNTGGDFFYTNYTVPFGNTVTVTSAAGLTIHATGTCTIAGTITTNATNNNTIQYGSSSGGSGGGAAGGTAGAASVTLGSVSLAAGGTAGASSGGNGGNGTTLGATTYRAALDSGLGQDGLFMGGAPGKAGANSGGAAGNGAPPITLICGTVTGTDGTHTGTIDASGKPGANSAANSTGAGSGGAGGSVILSSHNAIATPPNIYITGGAGGANVVPQAVATLGACTTQPIVSLGVTAGAYSSCAVVTAGSGCGTGTGITWKFQGGGGTQTTAAITPTFTAGALTSCTVTAGDSAGYTASTFTTSGNGGQGGNGWTATFTW